MHKIDSKYTKPLSASQKIYIKGSRDDIRVPMRQITLTTDEKLNVYDTSGVYTDENHTINLEKGLDSIRDNWIDERGDTDNLTEFSSKYSNERLTNSKLDDLRFEHLKKPKKAKAGKNVSQMHYAKQGIITS
jgi:phosphomethylpyrimidine synthase